jgi:trimeric autotransporter adhesin
MKKSLRIFISLCILFVIYSSHAGYGQITYVNNYRIERTFYNVSKPNGGVFDPNDTIEVRYTVLVPQSPAPSGGSGAPQTRHILKSAYIRDTLPANVNFVSGSMAIRTNEGLLYKGLFTDGIDSDQAEYIVFGGTRIVNIRARPLTGVGTDTLSGGTWSWNSGSSSWQFNGNPTPPRFASSSFCMITYRVTVNAAYGQFITYNRSSFGFRGTADAFPVGKYSFPRDVIAVFQSPGTCNSGLAISNVFENNGTFGTGKPRNRGVASPIVPAGPLGYTFVAGNNANPNDGSYAIMNNTSEAGSKDTTFNGRFFAPKIFDIFDIIGDHTGATNPVRGNPPVDTAAAQPGGGYMLVVNASYATNAAVTQTVNNVCPNTYYEFSAWFRNICARCGADSLGNGSTTWGPGWPPNPSYRPGPGGDSAGVRPNLAFQINDTTYYTSGDLPYDKTQTNPWKKRGFLFLNSRDSFRITIRNNSPGGGGNDWVMDDVTVSACVPSLAMNYTPFVLGCQESPQVFVNLICTIRYAYNGNYTYYRWERSTNNGATWSTIFTGGPATPTLVAGQWQYTTNYAFLANGSDSGHRFRVVVATTPANLAVGNRCAFNDNSFTYLRFVKCGGILTAQLRSFSGEAENRVTKLKWQVIQEIDFSHYEIEKSTDGSTFEKIGEKQSLGLGQDMTYYFTDPELLSGATYYRLKMIGRNGLYQYSNIVLLSTGDIRFEVRVVNNPITEPLKLDFTLPQAGIMTISLYDNYGKKVLTQKLHGTRGFNTGKIQGIDNLASGMYILNAEYNNDVVSKRLIKL